MAQIILKGIGSEKVKVIKIYREVTGLGLKEAKEAVDAVEAGVQSVIDGIDSENVQSVLEQFIEAGADVSIYGSNGIQGDFDSVIDNFENKTLTFVEQINDDEGEVVQSKDFLPSTSVEKMSRDETLNLLLEVASIARGLEQNDAERRNIEKKINEHNTKVQEIREKVSFKCKVIIWISTLFVVLSFGIVGLFAIVLGIIAFAIVSIIAAKDIQKHEVENEAEAQEYIRKNIEPLNQRLDEVKIALEELNNSGKIEWAIDIVGGELFSSVCVEELYSFVKSRRADSLKEALNLYDNTKHREKMEAMQEAIQYASMISANEATKQTVAMKEIEKSAQSAARTAKVNAAINYGTYRNAKQINKKLK